MTYHKDRLSYPHSHSPHGAGLTYLTQINNQQRDLMTVVFGGIISSGQGAGNTKPGLSTGHGTLLEQPMRESFVIQD